jgi:hypothetical protein
MGIHYSRVLFICLEPSILYVRVMGVKWYYNTISVILWWSVLLVEETNVFGENQ